MICFFKTKTEKFYVAHDRPFVVVGYTAYHVGPGGKRKLSTVNAGDLTWKGHEISEEEAIKIADNSDDYYKDWFKD